MSMTSDLLSATMLAQTIRMAIPYGFAALGGVWSERSGVIHIGLEGILLSSGLAAVAVHLKSGSAVLGLFAGVLCGAVFGLVHALATVRFRVNGIVSGIALNLIAAGGTRSVLRALYDSSSNSPRIEAWSFLPFASGSGIGLLARTLLDPLTVLCLALAIASAWMLSRTRFGLRVRACGESPFAAASVGISVDRTRTLAVVLGSAAAGLGGVALAYDQHQFQAGMSGGRGFIALAAVIVSGWQPRLAVFMCVIFAALDALQVILQDRSGIPVELVQALPYLATLAAVVLASRGTGLRSAPRGLGRHAED